jgi:hypothetical protein
MLSLARLPISPHQRGRAMKNSRFFEIADVLVRFDYIASLIVNANHSMM